MLLLELLEFREVDSKKLDQIEFWNFSFNKQLQSELSERLKCSKVLPKNGIDMESEQKGLAGKPFKLKVCFKWKSITVEIGPIDESDGSDEHTRMKWSLRSLEFSSMGKPSN